MTKLKWHASGDGYSDGSGRFRIIRVSNDSVWPWELVDYVPNGQINRFSQRLLRDAKAKAQNIANAQRIRNGN